MDNEDVVRVLHVDDDPDFADLTATYLEREDERFAVETATDSDEGLSRLADGGFDCVVSDYDMPGRNGIGFLRAVRERRPDLPFVLFTGKGSEEVASDAISAGVTDYLQKQSGTERYAILANRVANAVEQRRAARVAERTERRLTEFAESVADVVWMFSADWKELLFVNSAYEEIWGRSTDALREDPTDFLAGVHPGDRDRVREAMARLSAGEPVNMEYRVNEATGYDRWVWVRGEGIVDDGEVARVAGFARDVTERRRRERVLEELHAVATDISGYRSRTAVCERVVRAAENVLEFDLCAFSLERDGVLEVAGTSEGLSADGVGSMSVEEGIAGKTYRTGESWLVPDIHADPDANPQGDYRATLSVPIGDHGVFQAGAMEPDAFDEQDLDLAELLVSHATRALDVLAHTESLERYETVVEALGDPVYATDEEGRYTFVNDAFCELSGYAEAEILGRPATFLLTADSTDRGTELVRELLSAPDRRSGTYEITVRTADGGRLTCEDNLGLLPLDDGRYRGVAGVVRDISDRKARERRLELYETVVDDHPDQVYVFDADLRCTVANRAAARAVGATPEELAGRPLETFLRDLSDGQRETVSEGIEQLRAGEREEGRITLTFETADGTVHVDTRTTRIESADGELIGVAAVVRDITDRVRRKRELRRQNERLEQFAGFVSHDLRSPLDAAAGRLELARETGDDEHLDRAAGAVERGRRMVDDLLALAREADPVLERVDLAAAAEACWDDVGTPEATLVVDTDRAVRADERGLHRLLANLLENAVDHAGPGATVTVGGTDGGFYVADDGDGLADADRAFDHGFTTATDGNGIGLAIVETVAEAHGWTVTAGESAPGGTRFEVTGVDVVAD